MLKTYTASDGPLRVLFVMATARLVPGAHMSGGAYTGEVAAAIECLNVAGLCDPAKRNWYGVDPEDVVRGAAKLGLTPEGVRG